MKSAYELTMERLGGKNLDSFTNAQKAQLAEVHALYESKIAAAKMHTEDALRRYAMDPQKSDQVRQDLIVELASLQELRDKKKDALRQEFKAQ